MDARAVPQEAVVNCFLGLFPEPWFKGFRFPMVEDLINQSPFIDYAEWRHGQQLDWDGTTAPVGVRIRSRAAEGQQAGALSHKGSLAPADLRCAQSGRPLRCGLGYEDDANSTGAGSSDG